MRKLHYKVERIGEGLRKITVYTAGLVLCELECFDGIYSDWEEIQNWLDDNGYEDEEFDFEKIN